WSGPRPARLFPYTTLFRSEQLGDGGWNCWAEFGAKVSSFHTTICVLEGLAAWDYVGGSSPEVDEARRSAEEYLLERRLFRSRSRSEEHTSELQSRENLVCR